MDPEAAGLLSSGSVVLGAAMPIALLISRRIIILKGIERIIWQRG
jgi:hypothetical protein